MNRFQIVVLPTIVIATLIGGQAKGAEGEQSFQAGVSYNHAFAQDSRPTHGFGSSLVWKYGLRDDWQYWAEAGYSGFTDSTETVDLISAMTGIAYVIDAATWIPSVHLGVGYLSSIAGSPVFAPDFGITVGAQMEYRRKQPFSIGLRAQYTVPVLGFNECPGVLSVSLFASAWWR